MTTTATHTDSTTKCALVPEQKYLSFRLGSEEYGIDILRVQEIRGYAEPTKLANAPAFILGVLNLRGEIVPIIDMRIKFGLEHVPYDNVTVTIVLIIGNRMMGVVVDSVSDVLQFTPDQIRPAPEMGESMADSHITGLGTVTDGQSERMLILLDIEQLMCSAEMGLVPATA
ncbi:MAG: cheW [Rhodoferax sp.]|nr:cheW [Rhodoferax sp.]